jgi:uncharacterized membrane protein YfcA
VTFAALTLSATAALVQWGPTALVGLLVGFFVGLTGVGGGVLLAPVLVFMGIQPSVAVGTDLVYGSVTKLVGTVRNVRARQVDWHWTGALAVGSLPAGLAGSYFVHWLQHHEPTAEHILLKALGAVLTLAAVVNLVSVLWLRGRAIKTLADWSPSSWSNRARVALIGAVIGFLVGLTSVGSGSLIAMVLMLTSRLTVHKLIGTDIAHAMLLVAVASIAHLDIGTVDLHLAANLLVGSIPGVLIGGSLTGVVPQQPLKVGVCALVLVAGVKMLS